MLTDILFLLIQDQKLVCEQYRSRIGVHNHFVNVFSRFKDQVWNMMCMASITDNDVVGQRRRGEFATILEAKTLILTPKLKQAAAQYKM